MVTLQHCYSMPPIGKSLWRKKVKDGQLRAIKAKTQYPARADDWPDDYWSPDEVFSLIKGGLMNGKSIGFLRLTSKSRAPSSREIAATPALATVTRIIDEWLLLEYACVFLPCNQTALVQEVSKGLAFPGGMEKVLGFKAQAVPQPETPAGSVIQMPFTGEEQVQEAIRRRLATVDPQLIIHEAMERARGRL
jgi:hypothetical protein